MILLILMTTNKNNETIINTSIDKKRQRIIFWNVTIENTRKNEMLKTNKKDHHFDALCFQMSILVCKHQNQPRMICTWIPLISEYITMVLVSDNYCIALLWLDNNQHGMECPSSLAAWLNIVHSLVLQMEGSVASVSNFHNQIKNDVARSLFKL